MSSPRDMRTLLLTPNEVKVLAYVLDASYGHSGAFVSDPAMSMAWDSVQTKIVRLEREAV